MTANILRGQMEHEVDYWISSRAKPGADPVEFYKRNLRYASLGAGPPQWRGRENNFITKANLWDCCFTPHETQIKAT